jgi:hypothetical protein
VQRAEQQEMNGGKQQMMMTLKNLPACVLCSSTNENPICQSFTLPENLPE